ncbi:myo-inositol 2-dehydrogenase-like [Bolinopsis microptera]|uniref:myo-inositol 2-dehydrogenase-like n=1 Tax=Bolinopsis microptera TaxID=2820187 RepID=UPI003078EDB3
MYLSNIRANTQLRLCCVVLSPRQDPGDIRAQHRIPAHVTVSCDPQSAFSDPGIEAVIIASSTATHEDLILSAVVANKAVYCEKPISDSLERTGQCYQAAAQADLPLFCAFNRRFDLSYSHIQSQVRAGAIGKVQTIKSVSRDSPVIPLSYIEPFLYKCLWLETLKYLSSPTTRTTTT